VVWTIEEQAEERAPRARKKLCVVLAAVGVGVALILVAAWSGSLDYYRDVDALVTSPDVSPDEAVRVKGTVVPGSIEHEITIGETRFELRGKSHSIQVLFAGDPPPLFAPGREVVVAGRLRTGHRFEAYEVLTKCPSKYEALRNND